MIYVTHDQTEALTFADQVMVMYEGELVQVGTPQDLFERPSKHKFVGYFIGSPGMNFPALHPRRRTSPTSTAPPLPTGGRNWWTSAPEGQGGNLELGIRPHVRGSAFRTRGRRNCGCPAGIRLVEDQGSLQDPHLQHGNGHTVRARASPKEQPVPEGKGLAGVSVAMRTRLFADGRLVGIVDTKGFEPHHG